MEFLVGLTHLNREFFSSTHLKRSEKHIANPSKGSAAKRLNMFIRWMVRCDESEVDFGFMETYSHVGFDVSIRCSFRKCGFEN